MKKINLRDYYPYYTQDMIVEVPDEVALLLREYMLLEEAYRIRTYRYKAFYSLDRDEGIEREILQKPLNPAEIWEQRQMTELIYGGKQYSLQGAGGTASGAAEYTNAYRSSDSILVVHCSSFRGRPPGAALSSHRKGYLRWSSYRHGCC